MPGGLSIGADSLMFLSPLSALLVGPCAAAFPAALARISPPSLSLSDRIQVPHQSFRQTFPCVASPLKSSFRAETPHLGQRHGLVLRVCGDFPFSGQVQKRLSKSASFTDPSRPVALDALD
jgi:hypothetical protein